MDSPGEDDPRDREITRLHTVIAHLDEERDRLVAEIDRQSEALALMRRGDASSQQALASAEGAAAFSQREIVRLSDVIEGKDKEIASLRRQVEAEKARAGDACYVTTATRQELAAAAEDLASLTKENQVTVSVCVCV